MDKINCNKDLDFEVVSFRRRQEETAKQIKELLDEFPDFFRPEDAREKLQFAKMRLQQSPPVVEAV